MDAERCVCCGAIIPQGRQVCFNCEIEGGAQEKSHLKPRQEHDGARFMAIVESIYRRIGEGRLVPGVWLRELDDLITFGDLSEIKTKE